MLWFKAMSCLIEKRRKTFDWRNEWNFRTDQEKMTKLKADYDALKLTCSEFQLKNMDKSAENSF